MGGAMNDFVATDYEYVLWELVGNRYWDDAEKDEICQALGQEVAGRPGGLTSLIQGIRISSRPLRKGRPRRRW